MRHTSQVAVATLMAVCILAGFISPLVPTPLTALRSHHGWSALSAMVSVGAAVSPLVSPGASYLPEPRLAWRPGGADLIALTCVRLC